MKKIVTVFGIMLLVPCIIVGGLYCYLAYEYQDTYISGIVINNIFAASMTAEEVNEALCERLTEPSFFIVDKDGESYEVDLSQFGFYYTYLADCQKILTGQNPLEWGLQLISEENIYYELSPSGACDETALLEYLENLELLQNQADPDNIVVAIEKTQEGYRLRDDTEYLLDCELAVQTVFDAILAAENSVSLLTTGCYVTTEYTTSMLETLALWEQVSDLQDIEITLQFHSGDESIDTAMVADWIAVDEDGEFLFDAEGNLTLDEELMAEYVAELAEAYDTTSGPWTFRPTRGGTVTIEEGTYGYKLGQSDQVTALVEGILAGEGGIYEPTYSQTTYHGANGIGTTYIEVDMTNQMMYYYVSGSCVLSTKVVTGNISNGNGTPARVCYVYFKQRNRTLIGEDYQTPVSYWMAVYGNIGIHDATWRSSFGGTIYKTNGSHGCINTPMSAVSELYELVEVGTPVIMFY